MGQIANVQYICDAINAKWGAGTVTPISGTETQAANCEYLLKTIDKANNNTTTFGTSSYATLQVVDTIAVDDAVNRLRVSGGAGGKFVAVGSWGRIAYSIDGIDWISVQSIEWTEITAGNTTFLDITYGNGMFVAVGNTITNTGSVANRIIAYSTDVINWTVNTVGSNNWRGVTYGNDKFVAFGNNGYMAYSSDGINWSQITVGSNNWRGVTYGNDKFVAVNDYGNIAYSSDGINWSTPINVNTLGWDSVTYGNGMFVAISNIDWAQSVNGINWTTGSFITGSISLSDITYGNGMFVAVGQRGTRDTYTMAYSTNGINWTTQKVSPAGLNYGWSSIAYGNGKFVAIGSFNALEGIKGYSTNGIDWTTVIESRHNLTNICYAGD